ncbi:hypothetical protein BJ912DRAFT_699372 [Pholiota molesta]|nr:hypothetical protein BJ912DRAFT_699372 [Pholiota molesta]
MASAPQGTQPQPQVKAGPNGSVPPEYFYQRLPKSTEDKPPRNSVPSTPSQSTAPAQATSESTPIKKKATGSLPFASKMEYRDDLNEDLGSEMKGHFSCFMRPDIFLDKYLPLDNIRDQRGEPKNEALGACLAAIPSEAEVDMYDSFINAIKPYLQDMDIFDTHSSPDVDRDNLMPDVSLYPRKLGMKPKTTYFPEISTFVEFKASANADPFDDPPKRPPADFSFEREEPDMQTNRGQIGSYSAAISGTQFRTHVFSVSVCGSTARFILWDRSGAVVTARFDYVENPEVLVGFFYRYSRSTPSRQGYDPTFSPASPEDLTALNEECMKRMQEANKHHREFRKLMVPDRDDPCKEKEKAVLISYPPFYETRSPFSRATRAMLAFDLTTQKLVFLKDYWRAHVDGMEKEGEIYRILQEKNVPHIAPFGMGNDVRGQETQTEKLSNRSPPLEFVFPTRNQICLRHYRMTLEVVGRGLTQFESSHQFISAIADAMEAHDGAFFDCRVLHRDISVGNIIITDEGSGLLIDWDLCLKLDDDNPSPIPRRPTRTGTWQFMSAKLLKNSSTRHTHLDDRESAFYVLLWVALRYTQTERASGSTYTPHDVLRGFDEIFIDKDGRSQGGDRKHWLLTHYETEGIIFTDRPELHSLMVELAQVLVVRYDRKPTAEAIAGVQTSLAELEAAKDNDSFPKSLLNGYQRNLDENRAYVYQKTMDQLGKKGWLVDTIRKYLRKGEWPQDKWSTQVTVAISYKRKAEKDQTTLDSRATKRHSSLPQSQSSQQTSQSSLHPPSQPPRRSSRHAGKASQLQGSSRSSRSSRSSHSNQSRASLSK